MPLKSSTQLTKNRSNILSQAFAQLFGDSVRTFKFQLSQHMNNLRNNFSIRNTHEMESKSALNVLTVPVLKRSTIANPKYLKKAQSEKPSFVRIPYETSDPAKQFCPMGKRQ
ncbi:hypothetical protein Tco_0401023 [Tanacetum coccineum]